MSTLITKSRAVAMLSALVDQHGPDTVRGRTYVNERFSVPNCFAGCAFFAWGAPLETLVAVEGVPVNEISLNWPLGNIELTEAATEVLHVAQVYQDGGARWGDALDAAQRAAERYGDEE